MRDLSKTKAKEKIEEFFKDIKEKDKESIRKIKKLASHYHIRLNEKRKVFCKYCYSTKLKTRKIRQNMKTVECENCKKMMRFKI